MCELCGCQSETVTMCNEFDEAWCKSCFNEFHAIRMAEAVDEQETMDNLRCWSLI